MNQLTLHSFIINRFKVFFKLIGTSGVWNQGEFKIPASAVNSKQMKFPPDSLVECELVGPIIGELKKLKIWVIILMSAHFLRKIMFQFEAVLFSIMENQ